LRCRQLRRRRQLSGRVSGCEVVAVTSRAVMRAVEAASSSVAWRVTSRTRLRTAAVRSLCARPRSCGCHAPSARIQAKFVSRQETALAPQGCAHMRAHATRQASRPRPAPAHAPPATRARTRRPHAARIR
jgi:hypothetical protein